MKVAVIYVNPIEYHGPHLPLTTDFEISRGIFNRLLPRLQAAEPNLQVIHSREIHRGCDPAHGPGTESTSMKDLKKIVIETTDSILRELKPDVVLFMTFHGAPTHSAAIEAGVRYVESSGIKAYNPFNLVLKRMRDYDPEWVKPAASFIEEEAFRKKFLDTLPQDFHGGLFETSALMCLSPDSVKVNHRDLPDCEDRKIGIGWKALIALTRVLGLKTLSRELAIGADAIGWATSKTYAGYTGAPRLANPQIGNYVMDQIILKDYEQGFFKVARKGEKSPRPIMQWTTYL
jgi:creatinine amidohydrolase